MSPEELKNNIRAAAIAFTEELIAAFNAAFRVTADNLRLSYQPSPKPAPPKVTAAKRAPSPAKAVPAPRTIPPVNKRSRRSVDQLDKLGENVIKLLGNNMPGLRIEHINKQLGTNTRDLMRPIQKLLDSGRIGKSGERRATTYFIK